MPYYFKEGENWRGLVEQRIIPPTDITVSPVEGDPDAAIVSIPEATPFTVFTRNKLGDKKELPIGTSVISGADIFVLNSGDFFSRGCCNLQQNTNIKLAEFL